MRAYEFVKPGITEGAGQKPIIIYTNNRGATIDDDIKKSLPVTQISFDKLHMWESHKSMKDPKVADWVNNKLLPELEQNGILKPLLVWNNNGEFFVIDGNHRFIAYQEAGYRGRVPVQIVPDNMITVSDTVPGQQGMAENKAAGINKMFNNLGDPVYANLQRVALLAMQGRQQEAAGRLQTVIKDVDPAVQKKIIDAVNNIKPVTINGKIADSSTLDKSKAHQDWILNTFIPWVQSLLGQQGVAENFLGEANASAVQFQTASTDSYQSSFTVTAIANGNTVGHFSFFRDPETDDVHNQAEVTDNVQGKGYGKALLLKAIEVANDHGLGFQEDSQSLSRAQSRVYDSLYDAGWIVDADGYWFLTPEGEQELARISTMQQGVAEEYELAGVDVAYELGRRAYQERKTIKDNPYSATKEARKYDEWEKGLERGKHDANDARLFRNSVREQGMAADNLNELDMFAPVTTYVRLANGTYVAANWRRNQNLSTASNSASFIDIKPLAPAAAKQLGLDQRLNDPEKKYTGATTIASGGPIQASGPLADRTINVVDIRDPKAAKDSGVPDTLFGKIAQWAQQQGQKQPGVAEGVMYGAEELNVGDPVVITGNVEFEGKTGEIAEFGRDKRFVVVDLYNHGEHSFHSSDVSFNQYAGSDDEEARMHDAGEFGDDPRDDMDEAKKQPPEVNYDDEYDAMVARVKKLAGLGPMKTVYDPTKRVYRNMPTAQQPKK